MIEINLLPGSQKRKTRRGGSAFKLKLPESIPAVDRITVFVVAAWIIVPLVLAWMFFGVRNERTDLQVALDQAVADSTRYGRLIETQASLQARQDTIAQKLVMIQEIDAGRYIWPHILDEISRALPPYTWLESVEQQGSGWEPGFTIMGRTGSLPALTRFMDALEASPFLRNIELVSSERATVGGDETRVVNNFALTGNYQQPPLEMIETVPLFPPGIDTDNGGEENDGAGTS
jgi:Tfp pilus assembly protein PilN